MPVYDKRQPATIKCMFDAIASNYDKTNAVLSLQLHRIWNRRLVASLSMPAQQSILTDLCCGTGDIAFRWLDRNEFCKHINLIDFSQEMLSCAKAKAKKLCQNAGYSISYIEADVQVLPLSDNVSDYVTMAYGIRNVAVPEVCFEEIYRILKNKGQLAILELTRPKHAWLRFGHKLYLKFFLPMVGKWLTRNKAAYSYLGNSIGEFIDPQVLGEMLTKVGFSNICITPLAGGIATIISAEKL